MGLIAITGTPGTGKTALSGELRARGYDVLDLNRHIREHGLLGEKDDVRDTFDVDVDDLDGSLDIYRGKEGIMFLDGHLSHLVDCDMIIVLRCNPGILAGRLEERGYSASKVEENVQAEILDVILCESVESDRPVFEIDCSEDGVSASADAAIRIVSGDGNIYLPGNTDWSEEIEKWF